MSTGAFAYGTIAAAGAQSTPAEPASWPLNGWAMYGGYQISSQSSNFEDDPNGLPKLTWNSEKDVLIIQGLGWRVDDLLDAAAISFKRLKDIEQNCRILYYYIASEPRKTIQGSTTGYNDEVNALINSGTRGDSQTWYLRDANGNLVESQFDPVNFHRANCYATQFQTPNSFGRTFDEQFLQEHFDQFSEVRSNGERLIDLLDGLYWDVVDSAPERVFVDGSNGATQSGFDQDQNGSNEGRFDETIPGDPSNEAGYGGARMHRRGISNWLTTFSNIFGATDFVIWGNGTNDGIVYDIGGLSGGDPMDTNELYQSFDGTIHERIGKSLGTDDNGTDYDISFNPSVETALKRHIWMMERLKTSGSHPWGSTYGRTGSHMMVLDMNTRSTEAGITTLDYKYANFYAGLNALCGTCFAPYMNTSDPFPRPDTYIYDWGDPVNGDYPDRIATVDSSTSGMNVTLRAYDFTSGSADFWWEEFDNVLWVVRADTTGLSSGDKFGDGAAVACDLPDPGTGKKWVYADLRNYTNPVTGWTTRNQLPSIYDGSEVTDNGANGSVALKPLESVMLARVDSGTPPGGGPTAITVLDSWTFVNDDDPDGRTFTPTAGTDRVMILCYASPNHDISAFGWATPTLTYGGQAPTATYKWGGASGSEGANEDDAPRYIAIWNDAAIEAATSTSFDWSGTIIVNEFYGVATYENVQQTGLDSLVTDATDNGSDVNDATLTTTSEDGDRIIVFGGLNSTSNTSSADTLTILQDVDASSGNASYVLAEGNGGDDSTFIDHTNFRRSNWASIVLPKA